MTPSLLTRTESVVHPGRVEEDRGDHMVVRTPTNPTYYGGNQLVLAKPPAPADIDRWERIFDERVGAPGHRNFEWEGEIDPQTRAALVERGYSVETCACMATARPALDLPVDETLRVERIRGTAGWEAVLGFWLELWPALGFTYLARKAADHAARGDPGGWWVARDGGGRVIGGLGVYFGDGLGRFQNVETHPRYRRMGVCRTLMTHALRDAVARPDVDRLVIAADVDEFPRHLYARFGFEPVHLQTEVWNKLDTA